VTGERAALRIKICGLTDEAATRTAIDAGADMLGFVLFPPSPRHREPERLAELMDMARGRATLVALAVDPDDATLGIIVETLRPDRIQLHGKEAPERVAAIRRASGLKVIKAIGVSTAEDLGRIDPYREVADQILFDAKPSKDATRPGGLGRAFDWSLLEGLDPTLDYMLSGGLNCDNVGEAVRRVRPPAIDVSSGVEAAPGRKDPALIRAFIEAARAAGDPAEQERQVS
jgi:phosphoribosylanthranilate isomerase